MSIKNLNEKEMSQISGGIIGYAVIGGAVLAAGAAMYFGREDLLASAWAGAKEGAKMVGIGMASAAGAVKNTVTGLYHWVRGCQEVYTENCTPNNDPLIVALKGNCETSYKVTC